jgi:uncharacterized protein (TIGR00730 family)
MPKVRLSGTILGPDDPNRAARARLLYLLFNAGWDIYNSNGDQRITLANIENKIIEADAFVFTPDATLEDMFKAVSIFVGYQTLDRHLQDKPTTILNGDGSWDALFEVLDHLHEMGTISQKFREFLVAASSEEQAVELLATLRDRGLPDAGREKHADFDDASSYETPEPADSLGNVCVFCSATLEKADYLADGEAFGAELARNGYGCVSGAGKTGIMGAVVKGTAAAGGWAGGSNVPHIIELEGLPDGLSSFWLRPDIYTRMEVMIERSDAFVIFPGGAGTLQEFLALMIFKQQGNPLMNGKPVVVFNRLDAGGNRFWAPLIERFSGFCRPDDFVVADDLRGILPLIRDRIGG